MNPVLMIKRLAAGILERAGYVRKKTDYFHPHHAAILMYHRVIDPEESSHVLQPGMYVRPDTFGRHLTYLKDRFDVVPLSKLRNGRSGSPGPGASKPMCALTFDDGWYDFYENAFPALVAEKLPATVFLPTDFIGGRREFWTDRLSRLLLQKRASTGIDPPGCDTRELEIIRHLEHVSGPIGGQLEQAVGILKACRMQRIEKLLDILEQRWTVAAGDPPKSFVTWPEVREMAASGFIDFGSHTAGHHILTTLEAGEVRDELIISKKKLLEETCAGEKEVWFCYPNGNHNDAICSQVASAGYAAAVTTMPGWHRLGADPYRIRRIGIHQDMTSTEAMLGCRITGLI